MAALDSSFRDNLGKPYRNEKVNGTRQVGRQVQIARCRSEPLLVMGIIIGVKITDFCLLRPRSAGMREMRVKKSVRMVFRILVLVNMQKWRLKKHERQRNIQQHGDNGSHGSILTASYPLPNLSI